MQLDWSKSSCEVKNTIQIACIFHNFTQLDFDEFGCTATICNIGLSLDPTELMNVIFSENLSKGLFSSCNVCEGARKSPLVQLHAHRVEQSNCGGSAAFQFPVITQERIETMVTKFGTNMVP